MPRWAGASTLAALALAAACTRPVPAPLPVVITEGAGGVADVALARATVATFIAAEAAGQLAADTLLAIGADFVTQGIPVTNRPRLAAMSGRGEAAIEEARAQVSVALAWVVVTYRFTRTGEEPDRGRATFVLERRAAGWRVRHVHSSWVERWD